MKETFHRIKQEEKRNAEIAKISNNVLTTNIVFVTLAESGAIDEVTATEHLSAFAQWEPDIPYTIGSLRIYNDKLYKCLQSHTSQSNWTPEATPALWKIAGNPLDEWPQWSQPIGAQDAYMMNDKVSYNEKHWVSTVDNNVWTPGIYGWNEEV